MERRIAHHNSRAWLGFWPKRSPHPNPLPQGEGRGEGGEDAQYLVLMRATWKFLDLSKYSARICFVNEKEVVSTEHRLRVGLCVAFGRRWQRSSAKEVDEFKLGILGGHEQLVRQLGSHRHLGCNYQQRQLEDRDHKCLDTRCQPDGCKPEDQRACRLHEYTAAEQRRHQQSAAYAQWAHHERGRRHSRYEFGGCCGPWGVVY